MAAQPQSKKSNVFALIAGDQRQKLSKEEEEKNAFETFQKNIATYREKNFNSQHFAKDFNYTSWAPMGTKRYNGRKNKDALVMAGVGLQPYCQMVTESYWQGIEDRRFQGLAFIAPPDIANKTGSRSMLQASGRTGSRDQLQAA